MWGFMSFGVRPLQDYPSLDILFYRVFLCVGLMLAINLSLRKGILNENISTIKAMEPKSRKKLFGLILLSSVVITANWFFFIYVMNHISVNTASFAYLVCPIVTTVFAFFLLKERLTKVQWLAVILSLFSCGLLGIGHVMDILYSLVIASTYALYLIMQKKIVAIDKFLLLNVQLIISAIILLPFYPFFSGPVPVEGKFYFYLVIIAVFFTIIPLFLNLYSLKKIKSSTVGILMYINPLINFFLAVLYYNEVITLTQILAYSIILVSIILFNAGNLRRQKTQE
jgi:chloramphenicol-sensitive protein RarD